MAATPLHSPITPTRWRVVAASVLFPALAFCQTDESGLTRAQEAVGISPGTIRTLPTGPAIDDRPSNSSFGSSSFGYLITYFPPTPPLYGGTLPELPAGITVFNGRRLDAPDELADFVGETFYPVLSSRLAEGKLGKKIDARLNAYRTARVRLLDDLMDKLLELQTVSKTDRAHALRRFSAQQESGLAGLEQEAEQLRHDLVEGGLFAKKADWNAVRGWRLNSPELATPPMKQEAEFQVARATAFFQDGLSIEQRGLLRELAMESARTTRALRGRRGVADDDPAAMFFSPETTRFRLPSPLPAELSAKIGQFNSGKAGLKTELLETLIACESLSAAKRLNRFSALATEQQGRIIALENEAEEIRLALEALPDTPAPWVPPIPPELRERIQNYNRDRNALLDAFAAAQRQARIISRPPDSRERLAASQEASRKFEAEHADQIDSLRARYERIRSDLAAVARDVKDPRNDRPMTVESLLDAYRVAMQRFDTIGREEAMYERYKIAMLQPGLSPAQRRLLFRAAHANLAQALPRGEYILSGSNRPMPRS